MVIESTRNELIRSARELSGRRARIEQGLHFIEGEKLIREAVISGAEFSHAFIEEGHELLGAVLEGSGACVHMVKRRVMESLTQTNTPQWVAATVRTPNTSAPDYYPEGLIVALDSIQDPGNVGAVVRTADAMGAAGVLLGEGCADPFAPKPVRASAGSVYHLPIWEGRLETQLDRLSGSGYTLVCGHLQGESSLPRIGRSCALIIGNEGSGVSDSVAAKCVKYRLPMYGLAESLNVSVAAGIMIYELARQMRRQCPHEM